MYLTTDRLTIRTFKPSDIDDVFEIYSNDEVCKYLLFEPWNEENKIEKFQKKLDDNYLALDHALNLACVLENKVIGNISIWYPNGQETIEIGYAFNPTYTNKGYAIEAVITMVNYLFIEVKAHRIQAVIDERNINSEKLCKKLSMRKEAHFINDKWNKGEWTSTVVYAMLKSDFDKINERSDLNEE